MSQKNKIKVFASLTLLVIACHAYSEPGKGRTYFRYTNDQGVKVLNSTIPPKYAQLGYEVVNTSGQVLRVVAPAPTKDELAKADAKRKLQEHFQELQKRYKSIEEIESAKQRRLTNINTNISILKANINSLKSEINQLASQAAKHEREGREVPATILEKINEAKTKKAVADDSLEKRHAEYRSVEQRFDQDISAFAKGLAMINQ